MYWINVCLFLLTSISDIRGWPCAPSSTWVHSRWWTIFSWYFIHCRISISFLRCSSSISSLPLENWSDHIPGSVCIFFRFLPNCEINDFMILASYFWGYRFWGVLVSCGASVVSFRYWCFGHFHDCPQVASSSCSDCEFRCKKLSSYIWY